MMRRRYQLKAAVPVHRAPHLAERALMNDDQRPWKKFSTTHNAKATGDRRAQREKQKQRMNTRATCPSLLVSSNSCSTSPPLLHRQ